MFVFYSLVTVLTCGVGTAVMVVIGMVEGVKYLRMSEDEFYQTYIVERKAYEISTDNAVFASLREDYPRFDEWFDKCRQQHRDCWVLELSAPR